MNEVASRRHTTGCMRLRAYDTAQMHAPPRIQDTSGLLGCRCVSQSVSLLLSRVHMLDKIQ
jgi:hypothetical protein